MGLDDQPAVSIGAVIWTEVDQPEPVSPESPLVGPETLVLRNWLETVLN